MNRFLLAACAVLLTVAAASPVAAADLARPQVPDYKAPIYVAPFGWTGFYIGINGGYNFGKADFTGAAGNGSVNPTGALAGGTIGYNLQWSSWVFGIEGDFDASWVKGTDTTAGTFCGGGTGCEFKNRWFATGRGRVGYAFNHVLPYFTGGLAFGDERLTAPTGLSESNTRVGATIGGGLEYAFMGPWSAKIEYLYADLGKWTCSAATCGAATDVTYKTNIVRGGINYRF
jgi:outer membrane immunogenic protein